MMTIQNNIDSLRADWGTSKTGTIILYNKDYSPVAAIYLDKINIKYLLISETKTSEKYYIYISGIAIFFTYYEKTEKNN